MKPDHLVMSNEKSTANICKRRTLKEHVLLLKILDSPKCAQIAQTHACGDVDAEFLVNRQQARAHPTCHTSLQIWMETSCRANLASKYTVAANR